MGDNFLFGTYATVLSKELLKTKSVAKKQSQVPIVFKSSIVEWGDGSYAGALAWPNLIMISAFFSKRVTYVTDWNKLTISLLKPLLYDK